jgi:hypothetical protein
VRAARTLIRLAFSGALALATLSLLSVFKRLPYSRLRDSVSDALSLPGGLIAWLFYPAGVHTGSGAPQWATLALVGNFLFYVLLWMIVLTLIQRQRRSDASDRGKARA